MSRIFDLLTGEPEDAVFSRVARQMRDGWRRLAARPYDASMDPSGQRVDCPDTHGEFEAR